MATEDYQIRKALALMAGGSAVNRGDLSKARIGDRTIAQLLENEWAEVSNSMTGSPLYKITPKGKEKAQEPTPPKPPKRKPLKTLEPRLKTLQPALSSLKRK